MGMSFVSRAWEAARLPSVGACFPCATLAVLVALNISRQQASQCQGHMLHTRSGAASALNRTHAGAGTLEPSRPRGLCVYGF